VSPATVAASLVSHTNVGKTTLARTLLKRDIGAVRDEAHVTLEAERHTMVESPAGDRLELWDTPGFGDSVRLAKRLEQAGNPIGWFLSEVWDRYRDRGFWSSQRALRNVQGEADVVLYLVNASEAPADAAYLDPELKVLALIGKPVLVLLNQLGPPRSAAEERAERERWRERTARAGGVHEVLALDAFARCWVQEGTLLDAIARVLAADKQAAFARLRDAWQARGQHTFDRSMEVLAERVAHAALDREAIADAGLMGKLKEIGAAIGLRREGEETAREQAMRQLAERLDADVRRSTDRLIELHALDGRASQVVLARLAEHYVEQAPLSQGKAAMFGGVVSGALAGLKADLASGGLSHGMGLLAGGLLGALGAAGLAKGYNFVRGVEVPTLAWTDAVLDELTAAALLGYLAVAHYGRGRGDWTAGEHPAFWSDVVHDALAARRDAFSALWERRGDEAAFAEAARKLLGETASEVLAKLYPAPG